MQAIEQPFQIPPPIQDKPNLAPRPGILARGPLKENPSFVDDGGAIRVQIGFNRGERLAALAQRVFDFKPLGYHRFQKPRREIAACRTIRSAEKIEQGVRPCFGVTQDLPSFVQPGHGAFCRVARRLIARCKIRMQSGGTLQVRRFDRRVIQIEVQGHAKDREGIPG